MTETSARPPSESEELRSLEHLLAQRVGRQARRSGVQLGVTEGLLRAIRRVLEQGGLSQKETITRAQIRREAEADPVATLLATRVEEALLAGLEQARGEQGLDRAQHTPSVRVLRRGASADGLDLALREALGEVRSRLGAGAQNPGEDELLLLTSKEIFAKLRRQLPGGGQEELEGERTITFLAPEDEGDTTPSARVEVLQVGDDLDRLERRMRELLHGEDTPGADTAAIEKEEAADALIGTLFHDKYRILGKVGKGGFGSVYEARDERGAGNKVAIKVLRGEAARSAVHMKSFKDEARRVTRINHPNVVDWKVFDETPEGIPYFVMELVRGEELDKIMAREGRIDPERTARLLLQILDALRTAHHLEGGESILHLDLKPKNVFVCPARRGAEEQVKVIDFGIGQYVGGEEEELAELDSATPKIAGDTLRGDSVSQLIVEGDMSSDSLSASFNPSTLMFKRPRDHSSSAQRPAFKRSTACTPEYASPEQCAHILETNMVALDGRSDVYSLGVMAFQMLTGDLPFPRPLVRTDLLKLHLNAPPRKVGAMGVKLPKKLARFVDRCLVKDRDARFADTQEAYEVLEDIVHPAGWKTALKVLVPAVVVVGGLLGWFVKGLGGRAAAPFGLSDGGGELTQSQPLYMGPQRRTVSLRPPAGVNVPSVSSGAVFALEPAAREDQPQDAATSLAGWSGRWTTADGPAGALELAAPEGFAGPLDELVRLVERGGDARTRNFRLVWIGADSWEVGSISIGGRGADEWSRKKIDPQGLRLEVELRGPLAQEVQGGRITVEGGRTFALSTIDGGSFRRDLSDLALEPGEQRVALELVDRAGRSWHKELELEVVSGRLTIETAELRQRRPDGSLGPCASRDGVWRLGRKSAPVIFVGTNRVATLEWAVGLSGEEGDRLSRRDQGRKEYELEFEDFARLAGDESYSGWIELTVWDDDHVLHTEGSGRNQDVKTLTFTYSNKLPEFSASLSDGVTDEELPAEAEQPLFLHELEGDLLVRRQDDNLRMKVGLAALDLQGKVIGQVQERMDLRQFNAREARFDLSELPFPRDGHYGLRVSSQALESDSDPGTDVWDHDRTWPIVLDRTPPRLSGPASTERVLITPRTPLPLALELTYSDEDWGVAGSAPSVELRLVHERAQQPLGPAWREELDAWEGTHRATLSRERLQLDGDYRLVCEVVDAAGNRSQPLELALAVALKPPDVALVRPQASDQQWIADSQLSEERKVRVELTDQNGVAPGEVVLRARLASDPGDVRAVPLVPASGSTDTRCILVGTFVPPDEWSEQRLVLEVEASDRRGTRHETPLELGDFQLPELRPWGPPVLDVVVDGVDVGAMRLVRGNASSVWVLGGRGDYVENRRFAEAGLKPFNASLRSGRAYSLQLELDAGEIGDFYVDEYEVSCGQFLAFVRAGYEDARWWPPGGDGPAAARRAELEAQLAAADPALPAADVSWDEAAAYARWAGKRLLSWAEWEYAVRGGEYRPYASYVPGGTPPGPGDINVAWPQSGAERGPWTRGSGADASPDGIRDLCGNLAEWTRTPDLSSSGASHEEALQASPALALDPSALPDWQLRRRFVVTGGDFGFEGFDFFRPRKRPRGERDPTVGFRCGLGLEEARDRLDEPLREGRPAFRTR